MEPYGGLLVQGQATRFEAQVGQQHALDRKGSGLRIVAPTYIPVTLAVEWYARSTASITKVTLSIPIERVPVQAIKYLTSPVRNMPRTTAMSWSHPNKTVLAPPSPKNTAKSP